jgi:hypothetical protein
MFVTGLTKIRTASDTNISQQKKLHSKVKRTRQRRRKKLKFSEVKQNVYSSRVVDSNQQYDNFEGNEARCSKKTVQKGNTNENEFAFKHGLTNTNLFL